MDGIELTMASQCLICVHQSDIYDPPSPLTDIEERGDPINEEETDGEDVQDSYHWSGQTIKIPGFKLDHPRHRSTVVPHDQNDAYTWTEEQRRLASMAILPSSYRELTELVRCSHSI